jgi:glyoxylase-like metal-dependent hydrolase (beta-lactamase superfamily II)
MPATSAAVHRYTSAVMDWDVNVFLVETENGVVLVDGAIAVSAAAEIRDLIHREIKKPLLAVLLTHGHPDHYTGIGEIVAGADVPVLATQGTADVVDLRERIEARVMAEVFGTEYPQQRLLPNRIVQDGDIVTFDGVSFKAVDHGACESDADTLWETEIEGVQHVFAADLVYNHMHAFMRDGHARNWLVQLDRLLETYDRSVVFHGGHGDDFGTEMIHWQKAYIQAFLAALGALLGGRETLDEGGQQELAARMRSFLPNDKLMFLMLFEFDETVKLLRESGLV